MSEEQGRVIEFVPLRNFEKEYEILNVYPYTIRKKNNHYELKETDNGNGYKRVTLNGIKKYKHRIIAEQFLINDDPLNKILVDHINRDRNDNHLSNLRFVTPSENMKNRTLKGNNIFNYVDEISDDAIAITDYGNHEFEDYYYVEEEDKIYYYNGVKYKELHINETKGYGAKYVLLIDTQKKKVQLFYSKFKRLYGIK